MVEEDEDKDKEGQYRNLSMGPFPFIHTHMDEKYGTRGTRVWCVNRESLSKSVWVHDGS